MRHFIVSLCVFACIYTTVGEWVKEMENTGLYEGDMVLDPDEKEGALKGNSFASIKGGRWPGGKIPYIITPSIGVDGIKAINDAIKEYQYHTCLRFHRRTNESAFITFYKGVGCSSPVGYRYRRVNTISLGPGCWYKGVVMHEIGHSIGISHEQSRPDRDSHVKILWDNIPKDMRHNFVKHSTSLINSLGTPYDLASMMHYGSHAFGISGRMTIQTIDRSKQKLLLGGNSGFSEIDKQQIRLMYKCGEPATTTENPNPTKCVWEEKTTPVRNANCKDTHSSCKGWANRGECQINPIWMLPNCCQSCSVAECRDIDSNCPGWAKYCRTSPYTEYMKRHCKKTCNLCKVKKCWTITTTTTVKPTTVPNPETDPPSTTARPEPHTDSKTSIPDPPTGPPKRVTE